MCSVISLSRQTCLSDIHSTLSVICNVSTFVSANVLLSNFCRHSYGEQFSKSKWMKEMVGQRELLSAFAGIPLEDIRGMRAPFLAVRTPKQSNNYVQYRSKAVEAITASNLSTLLILTLYGSLHIDTCSSQNWTDRSLLNIFCKERRCTK